MPLAGKSEGKAAYSSLLLLILYHAFQPIVKFFILLFGISPCLTKITTCFASAKDISRSNINDLIASVFEQPLCLENVRIA